MESLQLEKHKINKLSGSKNLSEADIDINSSQLVIGLDIGSTAVKAVVIESLTKKIIWKRYSRHETKQGEVAKDFLIEIMNQFPSVPQNKWRVFMTGIGGETISPMIGAKYIHETNAIAFAVEKLHEDAGSVIELGGQDAKVIIWKVDPTTGNKQVFTSMNDKCAGGTGVTFDKSIARIGISTKELVQMPFDDSKIHHIAAKCGVFAETDVVNLLKTGVPANEIMTSLTEAIIIQNLSVLTRGNILRHNVYLLGGPNAFIPLLEQGWKKHISKIWKEKKWIIPDNVDPENLIMVPEDAQYYTAIGSALYGLEEPAEIEVYKGIDELVEYIEVGRKNKLSTGKVMKGLVQNKEEFLDFEKEYSVPPFTPFPFKKGSTIQGIIAVDGGSTSSKAILMDLEGHLLASSYQLSNGNPIQDTKELLTNLRDQVHKRGAQLEVIGFGVTGYAGDVLKESMSADLNLVETVAHMKSAVHYYGDVDVILDVGGQDIKVLFMENERIKDFRLNSQCSAGNGYFLQGMANQFGIDVTEYADYAFKAEIAPIFNYGCAVFMEQDKVNFQQLGWQKEEMMAGLALVLPLNIWQYIVQEPNLRKFGTRFVLQGGTQYNLAAVKAQVDYIKKKVPDAIVNVHKYTGLSGAHGVGLETIRVIKEKGKTSFIGLEEAIGIQYMTTSNDDTKCYFCTNHCSRAFIDTKTSSGKTSRFISGYACEKGAVESKESLKVLNKQTKELKKQYPNLIDYAAKLAFRTFHPRVIPNEEHNIEEESDRTSSSSVGHGWWKLGKEVKTLLKKKKLKVSRPFQRASQDWIEKRKEIRIGIPRVLYLYATAPFWRTYFEALGIPTKNIIFSSYTSDELWSQGGKWGSIDPCFPAKVATAHVHDLIFKKSNDKRHIDLIFFPIVTSFQSNLVNTIANTNCATSAGCPEVVKAAFTREKDVFKEHDMTYFAPHFKMDENNLFKNQLYTAFKDVLGVTEDENEWAHKEAQKALEQFDTLQKEKGKNILNQLEADNKVGIVLIGRPYHNDPGLNHDILDYLQAMGFPILSMQSLPQDKKFLDQIFGEDIKKGFLSDPMDITDVWKNCFSENSSFKIWATKVAARHPNLVIIDLSNFKCGHDAPIYSLIDDIVKSSNTPYFTFHDIDENKPTGSIKIRTRTIQYFLEQYQLKLAINNQKEKKLQQQLEEKRKKLLDQFQQKFADFNNINSLDKNKTTVLN